MALAMRFRSLALASVPLHLTLRLNSETCRLNKQLESASTLTILTIYCAPVAQLDRASGFEPEGREFESLRARHFNPSRVRRFAHRHRSKTDSSAVRRLTL